MTPNLWRALDLMGSEGGAASDWRLRLGEAWEVGRAYLRRTPRIAGSVIDHERAPRRLNVEPGDEDGYLGLCGDADYLHSPVCLSREDVQVLQPDWDALTRSLAEEFGFAGNRWESTGCARKIGTAQHGSDPARPVILCLPPGHPMRQVVILRDLAARRDATVLIPSVSRLTPEVDALVNAQGLTVVGLVEHLEDATVRETPAPYLPAPRTKATKSTRLRPIFRMQSGWTWDMLTIEVATGGRLVFSCGGQREDVRLPKSKGTNHSASYEILFNLAFADPQEWRNPPAWQKAQDTVRRRFGRLRKQLELLFPAPDGPFAKEKDRVYVPRFRLVPHRDLEVQAEQLRIGELEERREAPCSALSQPRSG